MSEESFNESVAGGSCCRKCNSLLSGQCAENALLLKSGYVRVVLHEI